MSSTGRHRRTRTLSAAVAVALAAGAGGIYPATAPDHAGAANYPKSSLKSQRNGTPGQRITVTAYGSEKATIDGSKLPKGQWPAATAGDHWTLSHLTFRNAPSSGVVATSSAGGIFKNLTTHGNGHSGFTLRGDGTTGNLVQNLDS